MYYILICSAALLYSIDFTVNKLFQKINGASLKTSLAFNSLLGLFTAIIMFTVNGFKVKITPFSIIMTIFYTLSVMLYNILTFDNGYEYQNLTANILDTLKEKNVKAAFFITLSYAKSNKALVQRMIDEGHIVGNHSTTHPTFPDITRTKMAEEIATLNDYLIQNFSYTSPYFRFPTGAYSECSLELVTSIGFKSVFWSLAYADWDTSAQKGENYAYQTVTSRFHPGAVILLHAVSKDNAAALGRIIDTAQGQGYTFKTLDDYFSN